jgi:uncharacterized protein YciI
MDERDRLKRVRTLRDHLERLPASDERDRLLKEVAGRAADIENGDPESELRPATANLDAAESVSRPRPPHLTRGPTRRPGTARGKAGRARTLVASAEAFSDLVRSTPPLPEGLLLSLEDDGPAPCDRPWTRGLRG